MPTTDTTPRERPPHRADRPAYWPTLVATLADDLFWLRELHAHKCHTPTCGTCILIDRLWSLLGIHDSLRPDGWTPPIYAPEHLQDAYR